MDASLSTFGVVLIAFVLILVLIFGVLQLRAHTKIINRVGTRIGSWLRNTRDTLERAEEKVPSNGFRAATDALPLNLDGLRRATDSLPRTMDRFRAAADALPSTLDRLRRAVAEPRPLDLDLP